MSVYDCTQAESRTTALDAATEAVSGGQLIVLPTDTVYGIGADAFDADAVHRLLAAKGRGRNMPPPVLVGDIAVLHALARDIPEDIERLAEAFWPGGLTIILSAQPSLTWDLGDTKGTVALRMPDHEVALELLRRTGPLAVSSANRSGKSAATTILDAATQLGDEVEVYLDGGPSALGEPSTIIDATVTPPEIVRAGVLTREQIVEKIGDIFASPEPEPEQVVESGGPASDNATDGEATPDNATPDNAALDNADQSAESIAGSDADQAPVQEAHTSPEAPALSDSPTPGESVTADSSAGTESPTSTEEQGDEGSEGAATTAPEASKAVDASAPVDASVPVDAAPEGSGSKPSLPSEQDPAAADLIGAADDASETDTTRHHGAARP
ncbi:L-threonylcarbamoyladenylate synthase [Devriesea agamarum]|uniref:L-threonylcarbamoyladenylate synthase n=1 Tax=Devriesea agamarum TaxID=472569 RepID=UPI0009FD2329